MVNNQKIWGRDNNCTRNGSPPIKKERSSWGREKRGSHERVQSRAEKTEFSLHSSDGAHYIVKKRGRRESTPTQGGGEAEEEISTKKGEEIATRSEGKRNCVDLRSNI